ncbi:site-specific integrase [Hydrogenophaga laconesensis]|uniref:Integrase n=1 Tax=Hydrogenophaga laconesensis TaxID=1805971 RepID=A0ABU1V9G7_9BURK|nr:site-specific integrase [Hydrogenophaga laconesensis]MDR7094121.1 integrase [Hydrogenophaga laconesensis]
MGRGGIDVREKSIRITFTLDGKQERRTVYVGGKPLPPNPRNILYAERLAAEIREKIDLGIFSMAEYFPASGDSGQAVTVEAQLSNWIAAQRIEASTKAGYSSAAKFWSAALPDKPVKALKHSDILKVIANRPDLSGKTINNYVSVLREAMSLALMDKLIRENPVTDIPRAKHQKEPPDPFSREEVSYIVQAFEARHPGQAANMVAFWFWTGMRTSEIFGLQWSNIDLASGTMLVTKAMVRGEKKNTKTNVARLVHLNSMALSAIQKQRQHTQMAGGAVFQDPRYGTAWDDERAFRRSFWTPILKSLGVRYRRPYNMRHSYATAMLMAGMTPAFCAKQLGHSVEMFLRTYSKWLDGDQNDLEMQRLEASLSPNYPQQKEKAP